MPQAKELAAEDSVTKVFPYEHILKEVICKERCSDNITVVVKDVQDVVPPGENFLSTIHRMFMDISQGDLPKEEKILIVKDFPAAEVLQKFIKEANIFKTEIMMYKKLLPKIDEIGSSKLGCSKFGPDTLDTDEDNLVIMEDLKQAGYKMADRHAGFDLDHCKIVLRTLARFHGISAAMVEADKSILDALPVNVNNKVRGDVDHQVFLQQYTHLSEIVETWQGFERFGKKLRDICLTVSDKLNRVQSPSATKLAVLNHGDFRLNNMLLKHSETGEVLDVKLVDFQMSHFASPAIDLHYFLVTSTNDEVKDKGTDILLEVYHSELCRVLEAVACETVTLDWLKEEMKDKELFALHVAVIVLNFITVERDNVPDFTELGESSQPEEHLSAMNKSYQGTNYRNVLQKLLLKFENDGVL